MSRALLTCLVISAAFLPPATSAADADSALPAMRLRHCRADYRQKVINLVNRERTAMSLGAVKRQRYLMKSSQSHSKFMAGASTLTHDGWTERIRQAGFRGYNLGQNVAVGYTSPATVVNGWMGSTGHRANILNPSFRFLGVGCIRDGAGRIWWTQDFGG